jgi:hypothetical protein
LSADLPGNPSSRSYQEGSAKSSDVMERPSADFLEVVEGVPQDSIPGDRFMSRTIYEQMYDHEISSPVMSPRIFKHQCCDCGLVHDVQIDLRAGEGEVIWSWTRNNRSTAQVRRQRARKRDVEQ